MAIEYSTERKISAEQFIDVLVRSTLAERRPVHDLETVRAMLEHANLLVTAWEGPKLVGVSRSVTDFAYCCYLSDMAVDEDYQRHGIGRELMRLTQYALKETCTIILLAAPAAAEYYPKVGYHQHDSAWVIGAREDLL